ncbi:hypothetical protein [uncultured Devosia sp.]|uniref:hypothetical protein n=1 Tax=uncultured Devosia sp. TaxID=211434 RepID=UPI00263735C4|nr:hypothetical protein [uncultured Devosia sp.]
MSHSLRRPSPLSIRLSPEERAHLAARAGTRPLGAYVKGVLFSDNPPKVLPARTGHDRRLLAQLVAVMGRSRIASNVADLASAARSGSIGLDDETLSRIIQACDDIRLMHDALMKAMGKRG